MVLFYGCASTASREEPLRGGSYRYILGISILKLTAKTEYAKHVVRNITFSEATGQDHNITGQTASEQVLFYLNVHLLLLYEHTGDMGSIPTSILTSRKGLRRNFVPGISLMQ